VKVLFCILTTTDTVPSFLNPKMFEICLDGIDPTQNYVDGKFSTLLASLPCKGRLFGDLIVYSVPVPFFKKLNAFYVNQLTLTDKDEANKVISTGSSGKPMTFVL